MLPGAKALKHLTPPMLRVLNGLERAMIHSQYVEVDQIRKYANLTLSKTEFALQKCHQFGLVKKWTGHFIGFELTIHGYDALALNALYEQKTITSIGREKGVGKESVVYFALSPDEKEVLLKFHRVGYTSFQHVKRKRRYTATKGHMSALYASRLSAESEAKWLSFAHANGLTTPELFAKNRHILVMEYIAGRDLISVKHLENFEYVLEQIITFIQGAWDLGFIHGDLSAFNIIVSQDLKVTVIDFPQSVERSHENADELLTRDIKNTIDYFRRKFKLDISIEEIKSKVKLGNHDN